MMINYRQERFVKERRQKIYGALFVFVLIIILARAPIFSFIGRISHFVGIPFWEISSSVIDTKDYYTELAKPKNVLVSEVLSLRKVIEDNISNEAKIEVLESENNSIKKLLNRNNDENRVLARVLSRPPMQVYDTIIIDIGLNDGVTEGSLVYSNSDYVLGKVTRVYNSTSVVTLSSSPGEVYSIMLSKNNIDKSNISTEEKIPTDITFTGIGGGGFIAEVPKHITISTGTPMVLSTINPSIVGIVVGESIPEVGSFKKIYGSLPINIRSIDWVTVKIKENILQ